MQPRAAARGCGPWRASTRRRGGRRTSFFPSRGISPPRCVRARPARHAPYPRARAPHLKGKNVSGDHGPGCPARNPNPVPPTRRRRGGRGRCARTERCARRRAELPRPAQVVAAVRYFPRPDAALALRSPPTRRPPHTHRPLLRGPRVFLFGPACGCLRAARSTLCAALNVPRARVRRVGVGYLSHDFGDHPTGHLFSGQRPAPPRPAWRLLALRSSVCRRCAHETVVARRFPY